MPVAHLLTKVYSEAHYNCAHYAVDVWHHFTGLSLHDQLATVMLAPSEREVTRAMFNGFVQINQPVDADVTCMVLMERRQDGTPHMGVWFRGRIHHLSSYGPHAATPAQLKPAYTNVRYYAWVG